MNTIDYKVFWENGMSYEGYRKLIDDLLIEGKCTGHTQSESLVAYTMLNVKRMQRIEKTFDANQDLVAKMRAVSAEMNCLVITEGWCGDAAQIIPVIQALTKAAGVSARYVLRDDNQTLMNAHLTNGAQAIPIILFLNHDASVCKASWGPRPKPAQAILQRYKARPDYKASHAEMVKEIQLWYAGDKFMSLQKELADIIDRFY